MFSNTITECGKVRYGPEILDGASIDASGLLQDLGQPSGCDVDYSTMMARQKLEEKS